MENHGNEYERTQIVGASVGGTLFALDSIHDTRSVYSVQCGVCLYGINQYSI